MPNILVFGAGLVAKPLVQYLLEQPNYNVKVATRTVSKAEKMIEGYSNGTAEQFDITKPDSDGKLDELIKDADLAVSLLPYIYHVKVANACIAHGKNMVTTSYVSDAMQELDAQAKDADIIILNEVGLDPGIDHMSAMRI
ncbi:MAG: saccharopine dehydrogenase NADP-binding domain-containing protein, partial [Thermoplasmata archaeon]|nr:saccharopine dehydrogenase NADP-binding domain-containing protein [Thermoplasmata archaeon]